jgi:hypothetical protein
VAPSKGSAGAISANDTIGFNGNRIFHLDCDRPRELNYEERALLYQFCWYQFCWDHEVAECGACRLRFRQHELAADLFGHRNHLCPKCRADLTPELRSHLLASVLVPKDVRARAVETRDAARRLITEAGQLSDRADVLRHEADAAVAALRASMRPPRGTPATDRG